MKHGANIYKYALKISCKPDEIIDFSSNINSYQPKIDLKYNSNVVLKYADSSYRDLKRIISKKYKIKKSNIALYNGATSAIFELFKVLRQKKVYLYAPLYGEYEKAIPKEKKVIKINRFKDMDIKPKKDSIVVFVNPSTPDAKYYNLESLFTLWRKQNCTIILDESFLEFETLQSLKNQIKNYKKLYIVQSFTKFYSCAGVRIGAIISHKKNIAQLKTPLWNLSSFDVEFLSERLEDKVFEKESKKLHRKNKQELFKVLRDSKLFTKIYKSDTNFFLVKSNISGKIFKHLLKQKILVRTCESFDFLSDKYLRFAVKNTKSHEKLKKAFNTFSCTNRNLHGKKEI